MIKCTNLPPPRSLTSVVRPYIVQCRYSARRIFVILFKWSLEVYWSKVKFYGTGTNCYWRGWCDLRRGLSSFIHGDAPIRRQYLRCRGMTFYIHLYSPFRQKKTSTQTTKIEKKHRKKYWSNFANRIELVLAGVRPCTGLTMCYKEIPNLLTSKILPASRSCCQRSSLLLTGHDGRRVVCIRWQDFDWHSASGGLRYFGP